MKSCASESVLGQSKCAGQGRATRQGGATVHRRVGTRRRIGPIWSQVSCLDAPAPNPVDRPSPDCIGEGAVRADGSCGISRCALADLQSLQHSAPQDAQRLAEDISLAGIWTHPLSIDVPSMAVVDRGTRLAAARLLGLGRIPVIRLDIDDPVVEGWPRHSGAGTSPQALRKPSASPSQALRKIAADGSLLPAKSPGLSVPVPLPLCRCKIAMLREAGPTWLAISAAPPQPSRVQILAAHCHDFGSRLPLNTLSASGLDLESPSSIVPHPGLRRMLESEPAMAALLPAAPCKIALGQRTDAPFRLKSLDLLLLPPVFLGQPGALTAAARWGVEAAFARQKPGFDTNRVTRVLRHGTSLIGNLRGADLDVMPAAIPGPLGAEVLALDAGAPSDQVLDWFADLVAPGKPVPASPQTGQEASILDLPVERVLVSNGDRRLTVDPKTGKNKYGTTPRPHPEAVHFSSSTALSISDYGFLYCDLRRRDLKNHLLDSGEPPQALHARLCDALIGELADLCDIDPDGVDGVIAASGTDTEVLALLMARAAAPDQPLVDLLIPPKGNRPRGQAGRGGAGPYFDPVAATGAAIAMGQPIWSGAQIEVQALPIRDSAGKRLPLAEVDCQFLKAGRVALAQGARVLAHKLVGSKTGLAAPSARDRGRHRFRRAVPLASGPSGSAPLAPRSGCAADHDAGPVPHRDRRSAKRQHMASALGNRRRCVRLGARFSDRAFHRLVSGAGSGAGRKPRGPGIRCQSPDL